MIHSVFDLEVKKRNIVPTVKRNPVFHFLSLVRWNPSTLKPQFNESEGIKHFVLHSRSFVIARVLYYKTNCRGT
jgi:hypothetical protein